VQVCSKTAQTQNDSTSATARGWADDFLTAILSPENPFVKRYLGHRMVQQKPIILLTELSNYWSVNRQS